MGEFFGVPGKKSKYQAKKLLNIGVSKLRKKKYFEALENFNKALCLAEKDSTDVSLAYASRAEVYKEIGEIEKSLENKKLAAGARRKDSLTKSEEKGSSFFKLSFPANEKIPFVANCLVMKNDINFGRYIITNQKLKPGDIIAIEEPFFKTVNPTASHLRCSNCLKSNLMNLTPSQLSSSSMFCSPSCCDEATKNFHKAEVSLRCIDFTQRIFLEALNICDGSFDKLLTFIDDPKLATKTVFDFDWNDVNNPKWKMHSLMAFNGLQLGPINDELDYVQTHPVLSLFNTEREKSIAKAFMTRIARILTVNCYSLDWWTPRCEDDDNSLLLSANKMKIGSSILLFGSLFNHSCAPNLDRMIVDNKFVFIVRRPIGEGEQVFISYGPSFIREPNESRQSNLKAHFHFECSCEACMKSYPLAFNQCMSKEVLVIEDKLISSTHEWKEEFKRNCNFIEENQSKFPSYTVCKIMDRNLYLLAAISRLEPFLF